MRIRKPSWPEVVIFDEPRVTWESGTVLEIVPIFNRGFGGVKVAQRANFIAIFLFLVLRGHDGNVVEESPLTSFHLVSSTTISTQNKEILVTGT